MTFVVGLVFGALLVFFAGWLAWSRVNARNAQDFAELYAPSMPDAKFAPVKHWPPGYGTDEQWDEMYVQDEARAEQQ